MVATATAATASGLAAPHAAFVTEAVVAVPELHGPVRTYVHRIAGVRVVVCDVPGPLCSAYIVVPTQCSDDRGLPHTLEHLVFCGSRSIPHRGYLDHLALRCLTNGTNAWTADDHTAYTATTAGAVGLYRLLPVFVDHVLHPTLRATQFTTEVYHVDSQGREQGVVFAEMNGRENTEGDLLDNAQRQLLYPGTPLAHECGGRTDAIATLTNDDIQAYHARFYRPDRVTVFVFGQVDDAQLLDAVAQVHFGPSPPSTNPADWPWATPPIAPGTPLAPEARVVPFPSPAEDLASISLGWRGPAFDDLETCLSLEVLLRYLLETPASPISQRFIERDAPLASSADYELKLFNPTSVLITFSGVPIAAPDRANDDDDDEDVDDAGEDGNDAGSAIGTDTEEEDDDEDDASGSGSDGEDDAELVGLTEPGRYKQLLLDLLRDLHDTGFPDGAAVMAPIVRRHRVKYLESLEDDSVDILAGALIQEVVHGDRGPRDDLPVPALTAPLGDRMRRVGATLDRLEHEATAFWRDLLKRWFLDREPVEVIMRPDPDLASQRADEVPRATVPPLYDLRTSYR